MPNECPNGRERIAGLSLSLGAPGDRALPQCYCSVQIFALRSPPIPYRGFLADRSDVPKQFASASMQSLDIEVAEFELNMLAVALDCFAGRLEAR